MADLLLKQLVAEIDKRTTIICLNAAGQVRMLEKPFDTLNGQLDAPPFHIHCRSVVVPYLIGAISPQRAAANEELQRRPKKQRDPRQLRSLPPLPRVTRKAPTSRRKKKKAIKTAMRQGARQLELFQAARAAAAAPVLGTAPAVPPLFLEEPPPPPRPRAVRRRAPRRRRRSRTQNYQS